MKKLLLFLTFLIFGVSTSYADTLVTSSLSSATLYDVYAVQDNSGTGSVFVGRTNVRTVKVYNASGQEIASGSHNSITCAGLENSDSSTSFGSLSTRLIKFRNGNFLYLFSCTKTINVGNSQAGSFGYFWNGSVLQQFNARSYTGGAFNWHFSITEDGLLNLRNTYHSNNTGAKYFYFNLDSSGTSISNVDSSHGTGYFGMFPHYHIFFEQRLYQKQLSSFRQYRYEPTLTSTQYDQIDFQLSDEVYAWNVDLILDSNIDARLVFSENNSTFEYANDGTLANTYSGALIYGINEEINTFNAGDFFPDFIGEHYNVILESGQVRYLKNNDLYIDDDNSSSNFFDITNSGGGAGTGTGTSSIDIETGNGIIDSAISPIIDAIFGNSTDFIQFYDINIPTEYENLYFDVPIISLTDGFKFELTTQQTQIPDIRGNALDIKAFDRNEDGAKFIVFFVAILYILSRLILVGMLFYLIFLLSSVLAKIFQKLTGIDSSKVDFSGNIFTAVIAGAFFVIYALALGTLYTSVLPLLPMANKITHLLTIFFSTVANTFGEYLYFATIVNSFFLAVTGLIIGYIGMRIAVAFGKLN